LDRALLTLSKDKELDLKSAQKIFGYFDKSQLISLFEFILKGNEKEVLSIYREIYNQGVEPKVFLNDFLEILYYFKNANSLSMDSTNFELNDDEFDKIKEISQNVKNEILILFWQFCVKSLSELEIVSNQHLSIEMLLIRLIHLKDVKNINSENIKNENITKTNIKSKLIQNKNERDDLFDLKDKASSIGQMKSIIQEKNIEEEKNEDIDNKKNIINSFEQLIEFCSLKKEMKLKYELEKNVNLVSFEKQRIEISFNENLDKDFIKNLSSKLYDWTNLRWIITLSKIKGQPSKKEKEINLKNDLIKELKDTSIYKDVLSKFTDAELIDVKNIEKEELDD